MKKTSKPFGFVIKAEVQAWTEKLFQIELALRRLRHPSGSGWLLHDPAIYHQDRALIELAEQLRGERQRQAGARLGR